MHKIDTQQRIMQLDVSIVPNARIPKHMSSDLRKIFSFVKFKLYPKWEYKLYLLLKKQFDFVLLPECVYYNLKCVENEQKHHMF